MIDLLDFPSEILGPILKKSEYDLIWRDIAVHYANFYENFRKIYPITITKRKDLTYFKENFSFSFIFLKVINFLPNTLEGVTSLELEDQDPFGDEGVKSIVLMLENNTSLTSLNLWGNSIGDEGVMELAKVLQNNTTLTSLNLGYNSIHSNGFQTLADLLRINTTLKILDIEWNSCEIPEGLILWSLKS